MAELVALGLASNVVQFVDFGIKLFSESREIYKSAHGFGGSDLELEVVATDLHRLTANLIPSADPSANTNALSKEEIELQKLAALCHKLADELLALLDDLKVKGLNRRKWQSFKQALRHAKKQGKIQNLEKRLNNFQKEIGLNLLAILRFAFLCSARNTINLESVIDNLPSR
jgi:hypothetical protein